MIETELTIMEKAAKKMRELNLTWMISLNKAELTLKMKWINSLKERVQICWRRPL
jgi:hypothetical protein